jgi:glycogen(starch) synthase
VGARARPEVVHVTSEYPPVQFGGLGTAVAGLTRALSEAGAPVLVLLVHGEGSSYGYGYGYGYGYTTASPGELSPATAAAASGVEVVHLSWGQALTYGPSIVGARRARLVHLHSSWLWPIAAAIREATGLPIVYTAHSIDRAEVEHGEWLPHGSIQDQVFAGADRVIALSNSERERLARHYPDVDGRVHVVGNGIHTTPRTPVKRHRHGGAAVLYVGRFGTRKGVRDVIEAVPATVAEVPDAKFVFEGGASPNDGPLEAAAWVPPRLRRHQARMTFLGWQHPGSQAVRGCYATADVLVVASRYEPFGMVVLEGMLAGQAIAAARVGGPAELLRHGRTALLYPAGDVDALAAAIIRLLKDVALRKRLGVAARAEVRTRWTWSRILPALVKVYADATA